jgi:hypothetical protein
MDRTYPEAESLSISPVVADRAPTARRRWIVGGLAAAVAAAAVGVVLSTGNSDTQRSSSPPAKAADASAAADLAAAENLAAAEGIAAAFAHHDTAWAASYLAPDTPIPDWVGPVVVKRDLAWGATALMRPCKATTTYPSLTVFSCPFAIHLLGSREVGEGPFRGNTFTVDVSDGKVTAADVVIAFETNGLSRYLDSVFAFVDENHPSDARFLRQDEADVRPAEWPRYTRLWQQYTREYVAATNHAS